MAKIIWRDDWAEVVTLSIMIITFLVSMFIDSAIVAYILIFAAGIFIGKDFTKRRHRIRFPYYMMIAGFLVAALIANWVRNRGDPLIMLLCFILGCISGHYGFKKDVLAL